METKYYKVEFSIQGKHFPCVIKYIPGNRHWICAYYNKDNRNDWFIRNEVISEALIKCGIEISEEVYNNVVGKILRQIKVSEYV